MSEPQAVAADCDHSFETRILGGQPLSVRICQFCRTPDWADLREQLDVLYGGNEAALTRVFGGDRTASVIAHTLNAHGHSIARVRYMTDAELLAVPGLGETSLATIRNAFPNPYPRLLACGFCYEEQGEEVHPHPECPINAPASSALRDHLAATLREHYLHASREEADADGNMPCRCGDWREPGPMGSDEDDWDAHLADTVLAALLTRTGIVTALAAMSRSVTSKAGPS